MIIIVITLDRRLTFSQRAFSGNRSSDHIAMLNAFLMWSRIARRGPDAEESFCEQRQISIPILKVTFEAKACIYIMLKTIDFESLLYSELTTITRFIDSVLLQRQLQELLVNAGFPEESMTELNYDFKGEDGNLDVIAALLVMGLTPNICYHKEKRKVFRMFETL